MHRSGLVLAVFVVVMLTAPIWQSIVERQVTPLAAQEDLPEITQSERQKETPNRSDAAETAIRQSETGKVQPQPNAKAVYLELARKKAELLSLDQLERETHHLRKELTELEAAIQLHDVEKKLQQLIEKYPDSDAAKWARAMLKVVSNPHQGFLYDFDPEPEDQSPFFQVLPDPGQH